MRRSRRSSKHSSKPLGRVSTPGLRRGAVFAAFVAVLATFVVAPNVAAPTVAVAEPSEPSTTSTPPGEQGSAFKVAGKPTADPKAEDEKPTEDPAVEDEKPTEDAPTGETDTDEKPATSEEQPSLMKALDDAVAPLAIAANGVTFNTDVSVPGRFETVWVKADAPGYLNAWIDFDRNGTFDSNERLFTDARVVAGTNKLTYTVPTGADFVPGTADVRFRNATAAGQGGDPNAPGNIIDLARDLYDAETVALEQCPAGTTPIPVSIIQNPSFETRTQDFQNSTSASTISYAENWYDKHTTGGQYHVYSPSFDSGPVTTIQPMRAGADGYGFEGGHSSGLGDTAGGEGAVNTLSVPLNPDATYVGFFSTAAGGYSREGNGYMQFFGTDNRDTGSIAQAGVVPPTAANTELLYSTPVVDFPGNGIVPTWQLETFKLDANKAWPYLRVEARNETPASNSTTAGQVWMNFDDFHMYECDPNQDFGDAPNSYDTNLADEGPRHGVVDGVHLGADIDVDSDGQPGPGADGDGADEDGVEFNTALGYPDPTLLTGLDPSSQQPRDNTLSVNASADGFVSVWVDWNMDGDFDDAGERVANAEPVTAGANDVTFTHGENPPGIETYVRVRYSTNAGSIADPTGAAPDGEVEDYRVLVERLVQPDACTTTGAAHYAFTFGDVVDATGTGGPGSSARYTNVTVVNGVAVDMVVEVLDGTMNPSVAPPNGFTVGVGGIIGADDAQWQISMGAAIRYSFFEAGTTDPVAVNGVFTVNDMDGPPSSQERATFTAGDLAGYAVSEGSLVEIIESDDDITFEGNGNNAGDMPSRFQFVLEGISTFDVAWEGGANSGFGFDGDSDLSIDPPACSDFGDAPNSYDTNLADNGPRHTIASGVFLGSDIDLDSDGQPNAAADGDGADDDGVKFNPALGYGTPTLRTGLDPQSQQPIENTLAVDASADGFVSVWVDWNMDGDWDEAGERVVNAEPVTAGSNDITFPQGANPPGIETYVRVRYSTDADSIADPTGAAPDGEVEDYRVLVERLIQPDTCTVSDVVYHAFTFGKPVDITGTGGPGSSARYENVSVIDGVAVDLVATTTAGTMAAFPTEPNGFGNGYGADVLDDIGWWVRFDATVSYAFFRAGTTTPVDVNAVFTVADMDGPPTITQESATFNASDLAGYAVSEGSQVDIIDSGDSVEFLGNGDNDYDVPSRFQVVLEGVDTFQAQWQGFGSSGFGFDGDGDLSIDPPACSDFGDAPDSYGTTLADDGPRHTIAQGLFMGTRIDFDPDGQPSAGADGDDSNRLADEDGVAGGITVTTGQASKVSVSATNNTTADATLVGWIDLNGNGSFGDGERYSVLVPAGSGQDDYELDFPAGTVTSDTFARFRLFPGTPSDPDPTGAATAGEVEDYPVTVVQSQLDIEKTSDATVNSRPGDTITYTVTAENTGEGDFTAANPARVWDDLSGVLDDATFNSGSLSSDRTPPNAVYSAPNVSWTGALPAGEKVTITYTVELKGGGDGEVRNVAFEQCDPSDPDCDEVTPECDPPVGGIDPDTGKVCDEETVLLPKLSITKVADQTELPEVGDTVEYTVTVENEGPGDYTTAEPGTISDDMSDVVDNTTDPFDIDASVGTATFATPKLNWTGVLASGDSATITYKVTYIGGGDTQLINNACVPVEEAQDPQDPCATVQIPGSGLDQDKVSDPVSGTPVQIGEEVTYTLRFDNTGNTAATVDTFDDLSGVLDDADFVAGSITTDTGLNATYDAAGERIDITGSVPVGGSLEVTYKVEVKAWADQGNHVLRNALQCQDGEPEPCDPISTEHPVPHVTDSKSVDPEDGSTVIAGDELTYTLTFGNDGEAAGAVFKDDALGMLVDDADIVSGPTVSDPKLTAVRVGDVFEIRGTLDPDDVVTVKYTVKVKSDADRAADGGDDVLGNFIIDPGTTPPDECVPEEDEDSTCNPVPHIIDSKSVDPADRTAVEAGDELTYTLTFENTGKGAGTVSKDDSLAMLLDDAEITSGPTVSDPTSPDSDVTATVDGDLIEVRGTLDAGDTVTVTYTVTVKSDADRQDDGGDDMLGNFLIVPGTTPPDECVPEADEDSTCNPVARIIDHKSVDPADRTAVKAGDELTYTLTFENVGKGAGTVSKDDSLAMLLDDAEITSGPTVSDPTSPDSDVTATLDDDLIEIRGDLDAGDSVTVTYTVTVKSDADRQDDGGDDMLGNFLIVPGTTPPNECVPAEDEDSTCNPVPRIIDSKSVNPADGSAVKAGDELTYTLTFENVGKGAGSISKDDSLAMLTDDAEITSGPTSWNPDVTATVDGDLIKVRGTLDAGDTVTVTYTVTVKSDADRQADGGDDMLGNFLIEPGTTPPDECVPAADEDSTCNPVARIIDSKSVDPADGSTVVTGDELTYTLTFENVGKGAGTVSKDDYLGMLLDDAEIVSGPTVSDPASPDSDVTATVAGDLIEIRGPLDAGDMVTVEYTVKVKSDTDRQADGGDDMLGNFVIVPGTTPPDECLPEEDEDSTCNPIPRIVDWKSVNPSSSTPVVPGQELTYTLTFTNRGQATGEVDKVDDLTHILDDADIITEPTASDPTLDVSRDGEQIAVTGELAKGQTVTVSYTVKVKAKDRGDDILANFLLDPNETPPEDPEDCVPAEGEDADCTINTIGEIKPTKTVDPKSGTKVKDGQELTYTLSFENVGKGAAKLDYTDHMAGVLDDAKLIDGPDASTGVTAAGPTGGKLHVTGEVPAGKTATVTYTVKVQDYDDQGDHRLGNFVTVTGEKPPTKCVSVNPLCTENPIEPPDNPLLPNTGGPMLGLLGLAALTLLGGTALLIGGRRRRLTVDSAERGVGHDDLR